MPAGRFRCVLTRSDEPGCTSYARITIVDADGDSARSCPQHAVAALNGIDGARVDWADTRAINEYERTALKLTEEISARRELRPAPEAEPEAEAGT